MNRASDFYPYEWFLIAFFSYVAIVAQWFFARKAWGVAGAVALVVWAARRIGGLVRDLAPLPLMLAAYREMNWFTPARHDHHFENIWIRWDRYLLYRDHLQSSVEAAGALIPFCLEVCYFLVYGVGPVAIGLLFANHKRRDVSRFWLAYLAGTLGAYALFPYFPSDPPRTAFPGADLPHYMTLGRQLNLWILGGYGIHSSVFPSAHVSSAFSAAWALLGTIPERPRAGLCMAAYACMVALATVYGRYHYDADALAGFAVSLVAIPCLIATRPQRASKVAERLAE